MNIQCEYKICSSKVYAGQAFILYTFYVSNVECQALMVQNEYEHLQIVVQSFILVMAWPLYNVLCNIDLHGTVTPVHIILIQLFHL